MREIWYDKRNIYDYLIYIPIVRSINRKLEWPFQFTIPRQDMCIRPIHNHDIATTVTWYMHVCKIQNCEDDKLKVMAYITYHLWMAILPGHTSPPNNLGEICVVSKVIGCSFSTHENVGMPRNQGNTVCLNRKTSPGSPNTVIVDAYIPLVVWHKYSSGWMFNPEQFHCVCASWSRAGPPKYWLNII